MKRKYKYTIIAIILILSLAAGIFSCQRRERQEQTRKNPHGYEAVIVGLDTEESLKKGTTELDICNRIVKKVQVLLKKQNMRVMMTQGENKTPGLEDRIVLTDVTGCDVFVSVQLHSGEKRVRIYYEDEQNGSKQLGNYIAEALNESDGLEECPVSKAESELLKRIKCPSVVVEISDGTDTEEFQDILARGMETGIRRYIDHFRIREGAGNE